MGSILQMDCKIISAVLGEKYKEPKFYIEYLLSNGKQCSSISDRNLFSLINYKNETLTCYISSKSKRMCSDILTEIINMINYERDYYSPIPILFAVIMILIMILVCVSAKSDYCDKKKKEW